MKSLASKRVGVPSCAAGLVTFLPVKSVKTVANVMDIPSLIQALCILHVILALPFLLLWCARVTDRPCTEIFDPWCQADELDWRR
jgi:hypothetical protein